MSIGSLHEDWPTILIRHFARDDGGFHCRLRCMALIWDERKLLYHKIPTKTKTKNGGLWGNFFDFARSIFNDYDNKLVFTFIQEKCSTFNFMGGWGLLGN